METLGQQDSSFINQWLYDIGVKTATREEVIMATYVPPMFNLDVRIWRGNLDPTVDPPSVITIGNLAWSKRVSAPASGGTGDIGIVFAAPVLLLPALTDVRSIEKGAPDNDWVEVPALSGRFYGAVYVEDLGKGFSNEHRGAILLPSSIPFPFPIP